MFTTIEKTKLPREQLTKVDEQGAYSPFSGVTVVSSCYPEHKMFCTTIYNALKSNSLVMEFFSPLPASSYHMTTMSLETEQEIGNLWDEFILDNLDNYRKIKNELETNPIYPLIEKVQVNISWTISLTVFLSKAQEIQIKETAKAVKIEDTVPRVFHITLAYPRPNKKTSAVITQRLQNELTAQLETLIGQFHFPMKVAQAKLCYFNDMIAFHPWNAESNPFIHKNFIESLFFSFLRGEKKATEPLDEKQMDESSLSNKTVV